MPRRSAPLQVWYSENMTENKPEAGQQGNHFPQPITMQLLETELSLAQPQFCK